MLNRYFEATEDNLDFMFANTSVKNIHFALISLDYIFHHSDFKMGIYHDEHTFYFFHIQSLLTACGNISNVFYNTGGGFDGRRVTERCRSLRAVLGIQKKDFPLVFQKEFRNTNEHFDERYDDFRGQLGDYNILDNNTQQHMRDIIETNPHLRTYDKVRRIYFTYNRKKERIQYDLQVLQRELHEMLDRITGTPEFTSAWTISMWGENIK